MSNQISFTGKLGQDAETKYTAGGMAICNFSVANNVGYGDKKSTIWFRCAIFGKRAESGLVEYLIKGQEVFISGELKVNEYTAKDGTAKTSLEVNANIVDLVGGKPKTDDSERHASGNKNQANPTSVDFNADGYEKSDPSMDDFDDDIPF